MMMMVVVVMMVMMMMIECAARAATEARANQTGFATQSGRWFRRSLSVLQFRHHNVMILDANTLEEPNATSLLARVVVVNPSCRIATPRSLPRNLFHLISDLSGSVCV